MKKSLLVISLISTLASIAMVLWSSSMFSLFIDTLKNKPELVAASVLAFAVIDIIAFGASVLNFIFTLIHLLKSKHPITKVLFALSIGFLLVTISLFVVALVIRV